MLLSADISLEFIEFIRNQRFCCVCLKKGEVEPHHLKAVGMGMNRKKPMKEHFSAVPVCRFCHIDYHQIGMKEFEKKHKQNMYYTNHVYLVKFIEEYEKA